MIIVRKETHVRFTKVDNALFTTRKLSDGAKILYGYLLSVNKNKQYSDNYIMKALGIGKTTLTRRKQELKALDLISIKQTGAREYYLFIGRLNYSASLVKHEWEKEHKRINKINETSEVGEKSE